MNRTKEKQRPGEKWPRYEFLLDDGAVMELPIRVVNAIRSEVEFASDGSLTLDWICGRTESEWLRVPNFGRTSLRILFDELARLGRRPILRSLPSPDSRAKWENAVMRQALEEIASEDYRGNVPHSRVVARRALVTISTTKPEENQP